MEKLFAWLSTIDPNIMIILIYFIYIVSLEFSYEDREILKRDFYK